MGTCMVLSSWSTTNIEDVAEASGSGLRWFQLYVYRDRQLTRELVLRAEKTGYKALVITVDTPIVGRRLPDARNRFNLPKHLSLANFSNVQAQSSLITKEHDSGLHQYTSAMIDPSLSWKTIDWLRGVTKLPMILKGILTAEDTEEALKHDIQGILVSNHGARQLDGVPATVSSRTGNGVVSSSPTGILYLVSLTPSGRGVYARTHTHTHCRSMLCQRL